MLVFGTPSDGALKIHNYSYDVQIMHAKVGSFLVHLVTVL